jgi:hypothetical protein
LITSRLKYILYENLSFFKFGFQKGHQIHETIGLAQKDLHSIHTGKLRAVTIKMDLSKTFARLRVLCIRLILLQLGFGHSFVSWDLIALARQPLQF